MKGKLVLAVIFLASALAFAQDAPPPPPPGGPGGPGMMGGRGFGHGMGMGGWWKNSDIATKLNLSDQQKQQLEKTFTDYRLQLIDQRAAVEREETKLQPLMDADQIDKAKVSAQVDSLIAARTKLEKTAAMMHLAMREILTADQYKQLRSLQMQRRQDRGMGPRMHKQRQGPPPAGTTAPAPNPPGGDE